MLKKIRLELEKRNLNIKRRCGVAMGWKIEAAVALAALVKNPTVDKIVPGAFDDGVCDAVSESVKRIAKKNKA